MPREAREQGAFKDWPVLMSRVKGVKEKTATKLSAEGLGVSGRSYSAAPPAASVAKAQPKKKEKADAKP